MTTETKVKKQPTEAHRARKQRNQQKQRCAILSISPLGNNTYQVWGGAEPHVVRVTGGQVLCDCKGWANAHNHVCSHVMKWRLVYGDLKK